MKRFQGGLEECQCNKGLFVRHTRSLLVHKWPPLIFVSSQVAGKELNGRDVLRCILPSATQEAPAGLCMADPVSEASRATNEEWMRDLKPAFEEFLPKGEVDNCVVNLRDSFFHNGTRGRPRQPGVVQEAKRLPGFRGGVSVSRRFELLSGVKRLREIAKVPSFPR